MAKDIGSHSKKGTTDPIKKARMSVNEQELLHTNSSVSNIAHDLTADAPPANTTITPDEEFLRPKTPYKMVEKSLEILDSTFLGKTEPQVRASIAYMQKQLNWPKISAKKRAKPISANTDTIPTRKH